MTGYTVHTGSTEKFAAGWDEIFRRAPAKSPLQRRSPLPRNLPAKTARSKGVSGTRKKKR